MNNKHLIKSASWLCLVVTISSMLIGTIYHGPTPHSKAAHLPNATPLHEITLDNANEISQIRAEMDSEGSQYYVWKKDYYNFELMTSCRGIFYQAYNKAGLPITQETEVESSCDPLLDFHLPDIAVSPSHILITYIYEESGVLTTIKLVQYYKNSYTDGAATQTVENGIIIDQNAQPRLAASPDGTAIGVVFQGCDDGSCTNYDIYFQGFDEYLSKAHLDNELINPFSAGNQVGPNIGFSGEHFMVIYEEIMAGQPAMIHNIHARSISLDANIISPQLTLAELTAEQPDIAGTSDSVVSLTDPYFETFYVTYLNQPDLSTEEIIIKKVYCEYDPLTPANYYCDSTSRAGEPVIARAGQSDSTPKASPQIAVFKNLYDLKRQHPYENSNIDYLTVAWRESPLLETGKIKVQNYTDTLRASGSTITVAESDEESNELALASNRDGHYTVAYNDGTNSITQIFPTQFLRLDHEEVIHAPDSNPQESPRVAKNSNGDYIIVYQNYNGIDYDVVFTIYNRYGNPVKNLSLANTTVVGEQNEPAVAYFNEPAESPDYGKFIIVWSGEGSPDADGIYYRLFNADGTPIGPETLISQNTSWAQSTPDLSTGRFGQFGVIYLEENFDSDTSIILNYQNGSNNIQTTLAPGPTGLQKPKIALNPAADGTTGTGGNGKFFATWQNNSAGFLTSGYLDTATTIVQNAVNNEGAFYTHDIDGAYNSANSTFTPPLDPFYYVRTATRVAEIGTGIKLNIGFYDSAYSETEDLNDLSWDQEASVSIDPATQNILVVGQNNASFSPNTNQVLFFPADIPSLLTSGAIYNKDLSRTANVTDGFGSHIYIADANMDFPYEVEIGTADTYTVTATSFGTVLEFDHDISTHFTLDQIVNDTINGGSGKVVAIGTDTINLEEDNGLFSPTGGTLDNAPYNDSYTGIYGTGMLRNLHFANSEALNFETGNYVSDLDLTDKGLIEVVYDTLIAITEYGIIGSETVLDFNMTDYSTRDNIEYIAGNFFRFSVDEGSNTPDWIMAGPSFSASEQMAYGQTFSALDVAYHSGSTDDIGKFAAITYASNGTSPMPDNNGVYQQIIDDPFSLGTKEDLSPTTEQQITPGGKYIIVPQTIDFGVVNRNSTATVDLADLTPSCIRITDLDGSEFDLTVSLTDLVHSTIPTLTIANSNFVIENNDGINPLISNLAPFSSITDVTLSPSTNPGQEANLGTVQTLLVKNNANTGSWKICPRTKLSIPESANSGTYSGTLTFTLI